MKPQLCRLPGLVAAVAFGAVAVSLFADESSEKKKQTVIEVMDEAPPQPEKPIEKSDEEWRRELTPEQYRILREEGTEPGGGPIYEEFKKQGDGAYHCAGCGAKLFTSDTKFESRSGWPSFHSPADAENVKYNIDYNLGYARTEVRCKICDGHLGHVFEGEGFDTPTDKRYCINGTVLAFVPADEEKGDETSEGESDDEKKADTQ